MVLFKRNISTNPAEAQAETRPVFRNYGKRVQYASGKDGKLVTGTVEAAYVDSVGVISYRVCNDDGSYGWMSRWNMVAVL